MSEEIKEGVYTSKLQMSHNINAIFSPVRLGIINQESDDENFIRNNHFQALG
jgi:hypothetical protein